MVLGCTVYLRVCTALWLVPVKDCKDSLAQCMTRDAAAMAITDTARKGQSPKGDRERKPNAKPNKPLESGTRRSDG